MTSPGLAALLRAGVASQLADAVLLRHELHADAEPSGSEHRTAARVAAALGDGDAATVAGTGPDPAHRPGGRPVRRDPGRA